MKRFQDRSRSSVMPSAYVTYDGPGKSEKPLITNSNVASTAASQSKPGRGRLLSPELSADGRNNGGARRQNGKSGAVQKSVDRLENWLGSKRRHTNAPTLTTDTLKRPAPKAPLSLTVSRSRQDSLDYSSSSVSTECEAGSSGASASGSASSASLRSDSSSVATDKPITLPASTTYSCRPIATHNTNTLLIRPQIHSRGSGLTGSNNGEHIDGHCPSSSFSISSSRGTSSGSSSTDSSSHDSRSIHLPASSSSRMNKESVLRDSMMTASSSTSITSAKSMQPQSSAISRRKIISKSQEAGLNEEDQLTNNEEDDDVWYDKDQLFRHHLKEVLEKWNSIDDEIWGKIICMEKNRRVAKAYARVPVLTINGSQDGFDGYRIGLSGFDNPKRDAETERVKQHIGQGIKLKMDNDGNILIKRVSSSPVYVYSTTGDFHEDNCFSGEVMKAQGLLDADKPIKVFDMKRFTLNIAKEMKGSYPDRRKLELQCFTNIVFVEKMEEGDHLDISCWVMLINIVALDMLKNKLPSQVASSGRGITGSVMDNRTSLHMENGSSAKRFLSTPRDEHYPRLMQQHSMADLSMLEANEYGNEDFDDRASISTYNFVPAYRGHGGGSMTPSSMMQSDYADLHLINQQQRRDLYRSLEQQHYGQDGYNYGMDLVGKSPYGGSLSSAGGSGSMMGNTGGGPYRSGTPLGLSHHALTEPNFKLRDSNLAAISSRNLTAPSLQRFAAAHSRHSRSYDSGLESDLTSSSDETDNYNRWTSYQRLHMLPRQMQHQQQQQHQRLPEWE